MPLIDNEYSTPKITPADGVKIPSVDGNSGYQLDSDLRHYIGDGIMGESDEFSTLMTYAVGDFCIYQGALYECNVEISTPGQWDASKWIKKDLKTLDASIKAIVTGGIIPKGDILSSNLPAASESNRNWQYYCTDLAKNAVSNGTEWVFYSNTMLTSTPDETDTSHALTNAVVTTLIDGLDTDVDANTERLNQQEATLNQHESRLENLEQKAGDYTTVQYRGTDTVPTGKAKNGLVDKIVGKSRAWNQLVKNGNFADSSEWSGSSFSIADNICTVTGIAGSNVYTSQDFSDYKVGHKYLVMFLMKNSSSAYVRINTSSRVSGTHLFFTEENIPASSSWVFKANITQLQSVDYLNKIDIIVNTGGGETVDFSELILRDLTLIFGSGNEPPTVAEALAQLPSLGQYNAFNASSLVSTELSAVKSVFVNIWDEEWEKGSIDTSTGQNNPGTTQIRSKNYSPVSPNTEYCARISDSYAMRFYYYDANNSFISQELINSVDTTGKTFTTPVNCRYIRFIVSSQYGNTYNHDIQISEVHGSVSTANTTYHPYMTKTLSLSETVTLRSDDELTLETGVIVRKMVQIELSDYDWVYDAPRWRMASGTKKNNFTAMVKEFGSSKVPNWICDRLVVAKGAKIINGEVTYAIGQASDKAMLVNNGSTETTPTGKLIVELDTPTTESIDPITDNFLEVEGGGTIDTIQEQSPVIDNCLDVGYLTV